MIFLTTGNPTVSTEGDQILVAFKSGKDSVSVALDYHQAMMLANLTLRVTREAIAETRLRPTAEIIPFPTKRARA